MPASGDSRGLRFQIATVYYSVHVKTEVHTSVSSDEKEEYIFRSTLKLLHRYNVKVRTRRF